MSALPEFEKPRLSEARRQQELIAAIFSGQAPDAPCTGVLQNGARWRAGLAAYRGNGRTHACNALRVQFPTILAMLGDAAFDALCAHYWRGCPPRRGDLAWVGEELPAFIETQDSLSEWPWLPDCARLDWAVWQLSGAPPATFTEDDLRRLIDGDPASLSFRLSASVRRLPSAWPIVTFHEAHRVAQPDWEAVRQAVAHKRGQTAWIWRPHGDFATMPAVASLDAATDRWIDALEDGKTLDLALDSAGEEFEFGAWLEQAVGHGWLDGVVAVHASPAVTEETKP